MMLICINFISAESIGQRQDGKLNSPYIISQPCATCSYVNISVFTKDGIILDNVRMVNNGTSWTYNFTPTTALRHEVMGKGDINGLADSFAFWFDVTLSGEQNNSHIIVSDIILLLSVIVVMYMIGRSHSKTDFDSWSEEITDEHKNMGQTLVKSIIYSLFKNVFIWYYFLGWILVLILKDVIYRFNSAEIYQYFTLFANIYSLGLILATIFMVGYVVTYFRNAISILTDKNWGINDG
jgi:hypothetical protein